MCLNAQSLGAVENICDVCFKRELVIAKFPVFHELCSHCIPVSYIIAGGKQHWPCTRRPLDYFQALLQPTPAFASKPLAERTKALHAEGQHLLIYPCEARSFWKSHLTNCKTLFGSRLSRGKRGKPRFPHLAASSWGCRDATLVKATIGLQWLAP